jgi:hypothetical protein
MQVLHMAASLLRVITADLRQVVLIFESPAGFPSGLAREKLETCYGRDGIEFSISSTQKIYPSCRI